jgi:hypothetical protein
MPSGSAAATLVAARAHLTPRTSRVSHQRKQLRIYPTAVGGRCASGRLSGQRADDSAKQRSTPASVSIAVASDTPSAGIDARPHAPRDVLAERRNPRPWLICLQPNVDRPESQAASIAPDRQIQPTHDVLLSRTRSPFAGRRMVPILGIRTHYVKMVGEALVLLMMPTADGARRLRYRAAMYRHARDPLQQCSNI